MNAWSFKWLTEVSGNTVWGAITRAADLAGYGGKKAVTASKYKPTKKNAGAYIRQAERLRQMATRRGIF